MPRKEQVQTRLPANTYERLEKYQQENNLSQADAARQVITTGLDHVEEPDGEVHRMGQMGVYRIAYLALLIGSFGVGTMV
jgi:hypothetical protein